MRELFLAVILIPTLAAAPAAVAAQNDGHRVAANAGLFSQYVFRGLAQTNEGPAFQGGFDYSYASGTATPYAGVWGSNISWLQDSSVYLRSNLELDFYGGIRGKLGKSQLSWDVGYLFYWYPGCLAPSATNANSQEIYERLLADIDARLLRLESGEDDETEA